MFIRRFIENLWHFLVIFDADFYRLCFSFIVILCYEWRAFFGGYTIIKNVRNKNIVVLWFGYSWATEDKRFYFGNVWMSFDGLVDVIWLINFCLFCLYWRRFLVFIEGRNIYYKVYRKSAWHTPVIFDADFYRLCFSFLVLGMVDVVWRWDGNKKCVKIKN